MKCLPGMLCLGVAAMLSAPVLKAEDATATAVPRPMPPASTEKIDYDKHIKPIMDKSCLECHNATKKKSKLRLDTRDFALQGGAEGPAVIVGDSANSNMIKILLGIVHSVEQLTSEATSTSVHLPTKIRHIGHD